MKLSLLTTVVALMLSTGAAFAAEGGSQPVIYPTNVPGAVAVVPDAQLPGFGNRQASYAEWQRATALEALADRGASMTQHFASAANPATGAQS